MSPPIDYLCLFWEICPPPPWALDLIRSHLKVTQASPRFVSKKHFADLGPHSLKLMVMKSCLTTAMWPELSSNCRSNKIIISVDVLSEEEVMMLINAADKAIVNEIIYWPKFLFLPSSKDHKSHNYWTHYFALILERTLIHFLEASLLIVIRFSDDYNLIFMSPFFRMVMGL